MPSNEKELNCYLFDQLSILEDLEEIAQKEQAEETLKAISKNGSRSSENFIKNRCLQMRSNKFPENVRERE